MFGCAAVCKVPVMPPVVAVILVDVNDDDTVNVLKLAVLDDSEFCTVKLPRVPTVVMFG